mgnify:CR=1 FL=1
MKRFAFFPGCLIPARLPAMEFAIRATLPQLGIEIARVGDDDVAFGKRIEKVEDVLAEKTEGYSGADLAALANTTSMLVIKEHIAKSKTLEKAKETLKDLKISMKDLEKTLEKMKPSSAVKTDSKLLI